MISHRAGSSSSSFWISSARFLFCGQLVEDVVDLQLAQAVELGLEHRVGLDLGQPEPRDQLGGGVGLAVAVADDPDRLVQVVEDDREAFEDVDAVEQVRQLVPQPPGDDLEPEVEEMLEDASSGRGGSGRRPRPPRPAAGRSG